MVDNYVGAITSACGLDTNQAKTIIYYAVATHGIERLKIMPILVILGPHGTGKSTVMELLRQITNSPIILDGRVSSAVLRDSLRPSTTALIEEADEINEDIILRRFSTQTSSTVVKRGGAAIGYRDESVNLFGASILHRRVPFKDPAVDSRSITITTKYKPGGYSMPTLNDTALRAIADKVDWENPLGLPSGRVADTWRPLFQAALACREEEWLPYAIDQVTENTKKLRMGHGYEPGQALIHSLQALFHKNILLSTGEPIKVSDVREHLKAEFDVKLKNHQIEQMSLNLGFQVTKPHGYPTVQPNDELLQRLLNEISSNG